DQPERRTPVAALVGASACVVQAGLAGLSRPGRSPDFRRLVFELLPGADLEVVSDAAVALWGALPEGEGVAVLAGTGSIALARSADGREARAGGYGALVGDEGSGFWLGRAAATAAVRAADGRGPPTGLVELVSQAFG